MRLQILTDVERKAIEKYLKDHRKSEIVRVAHYRARKHMETLKEDVDLLEELLREYQMPRNRQSRVHVRETTGNQIKVR